MFLIVLKMILYFWEEIIEGNCFDYSLIKSSKDEVTMDVGNTHKQIKQLKNLNTLMRQIINNNELITKYMENIETQKN